jgi:hypothetical protein
MGCGLQQLFRHIIMTSHRHAAHFYFPSLSWGCRRRAALALAWMVD